MGRSARYIAFILAAACCGCAWIDDVGTVSKHGAYTFSGTASDAPENDDFLDDAIKCIDKHTSQSFDVFTVHNYESNWNIQLFDQVRNLKDAVSLTVNFVPWAADAPDVVCPTPNELVGQTAQVTLDGCVRAYLFIGSCSPTQTYAITGNLTLDAFSTTRRETVSGSLEGTLVRTRTVEGLAGETAAVYELGSFSSDFRFPVHVGPVWMR